MSQHDFDLANANGSTFRADANAALQALASNSKGNSRPSTVYAGQLWIDDNTPSSTVWTVYFYDGTDDIVLCTLDTTTNLASMGRVAFSAHRNGVTQSLTAAVWTKVQFTTEDFDTNANFDNATNFRFTPTVAGKYQLNALIQANSLATGSQLGCAIYKNGSAYVSHIDWVDGSGSASASATVDANGSTDYFEVFAYNGDAGAATRNLDGTSNTTRFSGHRVA